MIFVLFSVVDEKEDETEEDKSTEMLYYKRLCKQNLCKSLDKSNVEVYLTSSYYHKDTHILVTGFSNGSFLLHELPTVNSIHMLR
jgi:periodic tryptophan protein 2